MTISYISANDIAEKLDYNMNHGWMEGHNSLEAWYRPQATFGERFNRYLQKVRDLGFTSIDLYTGHINADWATESQIEEAQASLSENGLGVASLAGVFGSDKEAFERHCKLASQLGAKILSGTARIMETDPESMCEILTEYGITFALENHPEKSTTEHLEKIASLPSSLVGVACDTGWYATQGLNPVDAVPDLASRLVHVHLKDIKPPKKKDPAISLADMGHESCRFGDGVVDIKGFVLAAINAGYEGPWMIEHEPEHFDPGPDCQYSKTYLESIFETEPALQS